VKSGILTIDVGGTGIKAVVLDDNGLPACERVQAPTPQPCPPAALLATIAELVRPLPSYDRISIGFPGVIRDGRVLTAANLHSDLWVGLDLAKAISSQLGGRPARIINDADMAGFALISGKGIELVVTLGTGFGSALFRDGLLMAHMELAHHPVVDNETYDQYLGDGALKRIGKEQWNARLTHVVKLLEILLHPDQIVLSGGNARHIDTKLPESVRIVTDGTGISGGAALWR